MDEDKKSQIWWKGALKGALKGIPIGIALGVGGVLLMWGIAAAFPALGLAGTFNGFLFQATAGTITSVNFIPFTLLNTALSVISGLFSGASEAVAEYEHHQERRQDIDRICQLEGRACALEHTRTETPAFVRNIVQQGIQRNSDGFVAAENARRLNAATEYNKA